MDLQNGYTVLNENIADGKRTFIAKGPEVEDKEFGPFAIGEFKLVYEKDGQIYGSTTGTPTADDTCFDTFDAIFVKDENKDSEVETPVDPENGGEGEDPADPADPVDPEDPADSTDPEDIPADPEATPEGDPVDPENPEDNLDAGENTGDDEVIEDDESSETN
jgi:hypothetical protein